MELKILLKKENNYLRPTKKHAIKDFTLIIMQKQLIQMYSLPSQELQK